ncbi:MAG TPA: helix-hairpin-helix domain-containing protein [Verrucomicrobiae bacterium]|nr:helix-hairpin-helix domain-containing protein [Verrucomicrobiae bacterium]
MILARTSHARSGLAVLIAVIFIGAYFISAPTAAQTKKPASATKQNPVDVNSADLKTLETLPGVGPTLAQRIVDGRPYKNVADLGKVKGLSKSKLAAIKDDVTFGPVATAKEPAAQPAQTAQSKAPPTAPSAGAGNTGTTPTPTGHPSGKLAPGQKININKASAQELDALPGIGPAKAQAIVDYRNQNGDFKTIDDIKKVKGIKEGEFSKMKDYITVGG